MRTITNARLQAELRAAGIDPTDTPQMFDGSYAVPSRSWLDGTFARAWARYMAVMDYRYHADALDCDDFALGCWTYARLLHAKTAPESGAGIAFGFYGYTKADTFAGHAINIAYTDQGIVWFEPQASKIIELDPAERMTCRFYAF